MQSISCHIILLVNNSLGDRQTCKHAQIDFWTKAVLRNQECTGQHALGLKQKHLFINFNYTQVHLLIVYTALSIMISAYPYITMCSNWGMTTNLIILV